MSGIRKERLRVLFAMEWYIKYSLFYSVSGVARVNAKGTLNYKYSRRTIFQRIGLVFQDIVGEEEICEKQRH